MLYKRLGDIYKIRRKEEQEHNINSIFEEKEAQEMYFLLKMCGC